MAEPARARSAWWRRGGLLLLGVAVVLGAVLFLRELAARARVAGESPAFATILQKARLIGLRDFGRDPTIDEVVDANYVSPQLVARLVRPGHPDLVRWKTVLDNAGNVRSWSLLDSAGNPIDQITAGDAPIRLGSLVLFPTALTRGEGSLDTPQWSILVLAGGRLRSHVLVTSDGVVRGLLDDEALTAGLAERNAARAAAGRPPLPDPRELPDRLAPTARPQP